MKRTHGITLFAALLMLSLSADTTNLHAQKKKSNDESTGAGDAFVSLPSGLQYKIVSHGTGPRKAQLGDHIELNIFIHDGDSIIFDSHKMNNNMPVPIPVSKPKFGGDVMEGFLLMAAGDSAIFRVPVDTLKKTGMPMPKYANSGDFIVYNVKLVSVKTDEEMKKEQAEKEKLQIGIDDKLLQDYFAKNNLKPMKTASGLYYTVEKEGSGEKIKPGTTASVNYTGTFIDGKKFDSNTDPEFKHTQPFDLEVGAGHVIKGWDEGLQLMKKGTKATLYIPSTLAYGSMGRGQQMPANAILIFNMEILNVMTADEVKKDAEEKQKAAQAGSAEQNAIDDKLMQEYFAKNNIKPTKTASGLYYVITQKGLGGNAKPGNKVTMNYTGKTLDGNIFDSNTESKFGHVQPFSFTLGQGMVIKGWDEGVQLLKMGGRATFYIPSSLAYGPQGNQGIAPNAVLVFDVEVVGIDKGRK